MRKLAICMLLVLAALAMVAAHAEDTVTLTALEGEFDYDAARAMLDDINAFRTGDDAWYWNEDDTEQIRVPGLGELEYNYWLERLAMRRAAELALYYEHQRPDGTYAYEEIPFDSGENIAYGQFSFEEPEEVFIAWVEENEPYAGQGHRRNMLERGFSYIGVGCYRLNDTNFWVQEFGGSYAEDTNIPRLAAPISYPVLPDAIRSISFSGSEAFFPGGSLSISESLRAMGYTTDTPIPCALEGAAFASSDPDVVSVSGDTLTAVAPGTATVTTTLGGSAFETEIMVLEHGNTGDFQVLMNGLMMVDKPLRVVADGPEGTAYYGIKVIWEEGGYYYLDDHYTSDSFWVRTDVFPEEDDGSIRTFTIEVYARDSESTDLGTAVVSVKLYPESKVLVLPEDLTVIDDEAFQGVAASRVDMQYDVTRIGARAFAGCGRLSSIRICSAVESIDDTAFAGCRSDLLIEAPPGSEGARFAQRHGYPLLLIAE